MWTYKGVNINIAPVEAFGFVYRITNKTTNQFYIGCKQFYSNTNVKLSKKRSNELYSGKGRKPKKELKTKESNWKTYISSSTEVQKMVEENKDNYTFEMLEFAYSKNELHLIESKYIIYNFLERNELILNKWVNLKANKL